MPMQESTVFKLNAAFGPAQIDTTAAKSADFAPGEDLSAGFVFRPRSTEHEGLTAYLQLMPPAVKEAMRATIYHALTSSPATPILFNWRPAYYFSVSTAQLPATDDRDGAIMLTLEGPFPGDANSPAQHYPASVRAGGSRKPSRSGAPKPAKRSPSNKSRKSS